MINTMAGDDLKKQRANAWYSGLILGLHLAIERWSYFVTTLLAVWAQI